MNFSHFIYPYIGPHLVNDDSNATVCESSSTKCFLQVLAIHRFKRKVVNTVTLRISNNLVTKSASTATLF